MEKAVLRRQFLQARQGLDPALRAEWSRRAQAAVIASHWFAAAAVILLYLPIRGEVATDRIAAAARSGGKRLLLPRVRERPRGLLLHDWVGEAVPGAYGILEPAPDWPVVDPGLVDLAVVPGVAFDRVGGRLGYGGGYYDRTLPAIRAANPAARFVGLAYGMQVVDRLSRAAHDLPVDGLVTEEGWIV